jgi:toxin ParE1/3/4
MARIELAPELVDDFDRILDHLLAHEVKDAASRVREIMSAIDVLEQNPIIGRPVKTDLRELVIGRRAHGYVALYRYVEEIDTVFVLAVSRSERVGVRATPALRTADDSKTASASPSVRAPFRRRAPHRP